MNSRLLQRLISLATVFERFFVVSHIACARYPESTDPTINRTSAHNMTREASESAFAWQA